MYVLNKYIPEILKMKYGYLWPFMQGDSSPSRRVNLRRLCRYLFKFRALIRGLKVFSKQNFMIRNHNSAFQPSSTMSSSPHFSKPGLASFLHTVRTDPVESSIDYLISSVNPHHISKSEY